MLYVFSQRVMQLFDVRHSHVHALTSNVIERKNIWRHDGHDEHYDEHDELLLRYESYDEFA